MEKAYFVGPGDPSASAYAHVDRYEPELDRYDFGGFMPERLNNPEPVIQEMLRSRKLFLKRAALDAQPDHIVDWIRLSNFHYFSPTLRTLIDELQPGVHRYFEVNIATDMPVNGKTAHGIYYLLRDPPVIDCLLFPQTQTRKGRKGVPWSKEDDQKVGGWGAGIEEPAFIDKQKVEGHHMWLTKTGNNRSDLDLTWSDELVARYCAGQFSPPSVEKKLTLGVV